jgi:peptidoglycan hydrolase-like protein with peptidoglycan-binding domain
MTDTAKSRGRRRARTVAAGAVLALVAGGGVLAIAGGDDEATADTASQATTTAEIKRQDLVETETVDGTLRYSGARTIVNRWPGTLTWTPTAGAVVKVNRPLYEVDGRRAYLLDGSYPAYRALGPGLTGNDVRQLERNLRTLGFDRDRQMIVDGTWDAGTTAAVRSWQRSKGIAKTGVIEWGRVVFQRGQRRVARLAARAGSPAASGGPAGEPSPAPLMTTTSTKPIVSVDLETTQYALAQEGARVRVEMPDGTIVAGTITRVGRIATRKPAGAEDDDPPATIKLTIRINRSPGVGLDQAPVDVDLEKRRARDVLTIPVTALLAREGGSFAVEVRDGDRRRIVRVKTGLYTDGDVEISGDGVRAGMTVTDARV